MKSHRITIEGVGEADWIDCAHWRKGARGVLCALGHPTPTEASCSVCPDHREWQAGAVPSIASRAISAAKAGFSKMVDQEVDEATRAARIASCLACDALEPSGDPEDIGHCSACGCPKLRLSSMGVKTRIMRLTCPLGRWPT